MWLFPFLLLACAINYVSSYGSELSRDLHEIAAIVPHQDLFQIFNPKKFDPASKKASEYVRSINFRNGIYLLSNHREMKKIAQYLHSNGIDANELFLQIVIEAENAGRRSRTAITKTTTVQATITFQTFVEQVYTVSYMQNIVSLVIHKTATSPSFHTLFNFMATFNYNVVYADLIKYRAIKEMLENLKDVGINTKEVWRAFSYLFGWEKGTNLINWEQYEKEEDKYERESALFVIIRDYLNLIPKEKFIFLYKGLLSNPLFQEMTTFIYNRQYYKILKQFKQNQVFNEFVDFLQKEGVTMVKVLDLIRDRLGFTYAYQKIPSGKSEIPSYTFSLCNFFDLSKQILPLNEIKKLTINLLDNSKVYREFNEIILNLVTNSNLELFIENQFEERDIVMQYGVSMPKIINFLLVIIGVDYEMPVKGVEFTEDIYEFVNMIPKYDYIDLYNKYKNDSDIWTMVAYLKGSKFIHFVEDLFTTAEMKLFINFLRKERVPFKTILVDIFNQLGIMQWWINYDYYCGRVLRCNGTINPNSDSLSNFVRDRIELFPLKDILRLFNSKLQNNPYFQNLYWVLANLDAANLFRKIVEHPGLRDFFVRLCKIGHNFRAIIKQFGNIFNWEKVLVVDVSLNQTMENYGDFIYRKALFKILDRYPLEVQQVQEYLKNTAFINSFSLLLNYPEIRNIILWMEDLNVPVMDFINYYTGMDTPNAFHLRLDVQLKWKELGEEVLMFLIKNKLYDFTVTQKKNSIEFNALLDKLYALDSNVIDLALDNPEFHFVLDKLLVTGFDYMQPYLFLQDVVNEGVKNKNKNRIN